MIRTPSQTAILATSVDWMGSHFDGGANLLRHPSAPQRHAVRESLWYAAGLLAQGEGTTRAASIIDTVLDLQFDARGTIWDGTWPRAPEEPLPAADAVIWRDYDPNWRQFIGCLLGVLSCDFARVLGAARCERIHEAIARALVGEPAQRIVPSYSNIALMQAWLQAEFGNRVQGEWLAAAVEALYRSEGGFHEFNSPTYYGVDLWGLALWRRSSSPALVVAGQRLEAALWRDIADFYHPGLRNLCGPYDRAYGADMTRYAALLGLWLWWVGGEATRAFPDTTRPFGHAHDFCAAPLIAMAPPGVDAVTAAALIEPVTNRRIERRQGNRVITAALYRDLMLGATDMPLRDPTGGQAMPVMAHWVDADQCVAWLCVRGAPLSAVVEETTIMLRSDVALMLSGVASASNEINERWWRIGGRRIEARGFEIASPSVWDGEMRCSLRLPSGEGQLRFT